MLVVICKILEYLSRIKHTLPEEKDQSTLLQSNEAGISSRKRDELDKFRANPDEMAVFRTAKVSVNMILTSQPMRLSRSLFQNIFFERRYPLWARFYDASEFKVGRQSLRNRLSNISKCMKFDWCTISRDELRTALKKTFLNCYVPAPQ